MRPIAIVIEGAGDNFSGYVPDLPICIASGDTLEEVAELLREAFVLYRESLLEDGEPLPDLQSATDDDNFHL